MPHFIVIGAGPAGIAAAIFLSKRGFSSVVYEKAADLRQSDEESYPIGLNPRGMNVLDLLDESGSLRHQVASKTPIDAWSIYSGSKRVAQLQSGTTVGATRGGVANCIYDEAMKNHLKLITFHFQHKLVSIDFTRKHLQFEDSQGNLIDVDGSESRIIAADGVWSQVRRQYEKFNPEFSPSVRKWDCSFRLLFSGDDTKSTLNPREHHICSGIYVAILKNNRWVLAIQISNDNPIKDVLLSDNPSPENILKLKSFVQETAPLAAPMVPEDDYPRYFSRRTFSGAVVCVPKLNVDEWVLFLGDSAHSVYPAIGEGINCALEDTKVFNSLFDQGSDANLFERYHQQRYKDIVAVTTYARYLVENSSQTAEERISRLITTISLQIAQKIGICGPVWNDKSFGTAAGRVEPYSELLDAWKRQTKYLLPVSKVLGYSLVSLHRFRFVFVAVVFATLLYFLYP